MDGKMNVFVLLDHDSIDQYVCKVFMFIIYHSRT